MISDPDYACDSQFLKLLARQTDVDLTTAALELARDAYPGLDFRPTLDWIQDRADELAAPVSRAHSGPQVLWELGRCLAERHGLHGNESAYDRADSSYLHRVIETKRGIPISLSVLYMAVAQRVGIDLRGVAAPMHFLTRYDSVDGPLFVDAFTHGRVLQEQECRQWIGEISQLWGQAVEAALRPVGPRAIVIRMLNNLKAVYTGQEDWRAAWIVQHRLTALEPFRYQHRRDLALLALRADRPGQAVDLFRSCLRGCPQRDRPSLERHLFEAQAQLARWN